MDETDRPKKRRTRAHVPENGMYYTMHNVENDLPVIPVKPKIKRGPYDSFPTTTPNNNNNKRLSSNDATNNKINNTDSPVKFKDPSRVYKNNVTKEITKGSGIQEYSNNNNNTKNLNQQLKDPLVPIPWFLVPFASLSPERANGRIARVYKVGLRTPQGVSTDVYVIFLMHQMVIGAIGGVFLGLETGYLSLEPPKSPTPAESTAPLPKSSVYQTSLAGTNVLLRTAKRAVVGGLLFNFLEKNIEESRNKSDWKNSLYSGAISGALFGLRGGFRGAMLGSAILAGFGGMSGFYDQLKRKNKVK